MADSETISSDRYTLRVKDNKLYIDDVKSENEENDINWKEVMMLRYKQLEEPDSTSIVELDEEIEWDNYMILKEELSRVGVVYKRNVKKKVFLEQKRDFMIGKEDDKIVVRQIDGSPMDVEELILNQFILSIIKSARIIQLSNGSEPLHKNTNLNKYVDEEIKRGIIFNGQDVKGDVFYATPMRRRR